MLGNGRTGNGNDNIKTNDGDTMEDKAKVGSVEWAISASTNRQVKRSRARCYQFGCHWKWKYKEKDWNLWI